MPGVYVSSRIIVERTLHDLYLSVFLARYERGDRTLCDAYINNQASNRVHFWT